MEEIRNKCSVVSKGYRGQPAAIGRAAAAMDWTKCLLLLYCVCHFAASNEPDCVFELSCRECVPEHMPLVTSHRAANGSVRAASGDEVSLSCGAGRLLLYPLRAALAARCEAGRLRVAHDAALRHALELGCQASVFDDALHEVEHCVPPLQGRAYRLQEDGEKVRHLATVCLDEDRGLATFARTSNAPDNALRLAPHSDARAPLSLLGNLNQVFDASTRRAAEQLYSDDARMNRRLRELLKFDDVALGEQTLTTARLLSPLYFDDQNARVADFASNMFPAWRGVALGNLAHAQRDVARFLRLARPHARVDVFAGTHGEAALRTGEGRRAPRLRAGRFPAPRYVWTALVDRAAGRALALVVLNEPLVAVSEVRAAVFCESACGRVSWLRALQRHRNYEAPALGLAFCCELHAFAAQVPELPPAALAGVTRGPEGLLTDMYT